MPPRASTGAPRTPPRPARAGAAAATPAAGGGPRKREEAAGGAGAGAGAAKKPRTAAGTLDDEGYARGGLKHLEEACPRMKEVLAKVGVPGRLQARWGAQGKAGEGAQIDDVATARGDGHSSFRSLLRAVVYQQLNGKAADTIHRRVVGALACSAAEVTPAHVIRADAAALRQAGLSQRKLEYVQGLAEHFSGGLDDAALKSMDPDDMFNRLVSIRGVGPWTVHMFSIFTLGHCDVLPSSDLIVAKGIASLYRVDVSPKRLGSKDAHAKLAAATEHWRPFRSLGALLMWEHFGAAPPAFAGMPAVAAPAGVAAPANAMFGPKSTKKKKGTRRRR